jgi:hypothetical protein
MKPVFALGAAAVLGGLLYALLADREAELAPARASSVDDEPVRPVERLHAPQLVRRTRVAEPPRAARDEPGATAVTTTDVHDHLEGTFRADPVDAAWSQRAVSTLHTKLGGVLPSGSSVRGVECRGSLCRIETTHAGLTEYRAFMDKAVLSQVGLWNGGFFADVVGTPEEGRPIATVLYLAREGQSLPPPEGLAAAP